MLGIRGVEGFGGQVDRNLASRPFRLQKGPKALPGSPWKLKAQGTKGETLKGPFGVIQGLYETI